MELRGSGMDIAASRGPGGREADAVVRVRSLEIFAGGKALYFRTSPQKDTYTRGTSVGATAECGGCSDKSASLYIEPYIAQRARIQIFSQAGTRTRSPSTSYPESEMRSSSRE